MHGNELEKYYKQYANKLYYYAFSLCKEDAMAKDLVSDTFLKAFQSLPDAHVNVEAWLFQVLHHLFLDMTRKKKRHPWLSFDQLPVFKAKENPKEAFEEHERNHDLITKLFSLPVIYRDVLYEYYFAQKSIQEISRQYSLSESNVKIRLLRGRSMLKKEMEEHQDEI